MGRSAPGQKKVTTVWLEEEAMSGHRMFFCPNCKIPVVKYKGRISKIIPGNTPYEPYTLLKCKGTVRREDGEWENCGQHYVFQFGIQTKNPEFE